MNHLSALFVALLIGATSFAQLPDGSCGDGCDPTDLNTCSTYSNGDGQVNVTDLLTLLGEFGTTCA
jgi:hypothetical protein